jgi:hypothetical protein
MLLPGQPRVDNFGFFSLIKVDLFDLTFIYGYRDGKGGRACMPLRKKIRLLAK